MTTIWIHHKHTCIHHPPYRTPPSRPYYVRAQHRRTVTIRQLLFLPVGRTAHNHYCNNLDSGTHMPAVFNCHSPLVSNSTGALLLLRGKYCLFFFERFPQKKMQRFISWTKLSGNLSKGEVGTQRSAMVPASCWVLSRQSSPSTGSFAEDCPN
jgi:hypothetical protein